MSSQFYDEIVRPHEVAQEFIRDTGNLPEIVMAAEGLFNAVTKTRVEITEAQFSKDRFPTEQTAQLQNSLETEAKGLSPRMLEAIGREGLAGAKRFSLEVRLRQSEAQVFNAINDLVELRTDLIVSQQDI